APLGEITAVVLNAVPGAPQRTAAVAAVVVDDRYVRDVERLGNSVDAPGEIDILAVEEEAFVEAPECVGGLGPQQHERPLKVGEVRDGVVIPAAQLVTAIRPLGPAGARKEATQEEIGGGRQ